MNNKTDKGQKSLHKPSNEYKSQGNKDVKEQNQLCTEITKYQI